jgi:hypothetical protein
MNKDCIIHIPVTRKVRDELRRIARHDDVPLARVVRNAIYDFFEKQEDLCDSHADAKKRRSARRQGARSADAVQTT